MEPDKVGYSMTLKVGLPNYGSADVQVSYTSSVQEGETAEQAHKRVVDFVEEKLKVGREKLLAMQETQTEASVVHTETKTAPSNFPLAKAIVPGGMAGVNLPKGFPSGSPTTEKKTSGFPAPAKTEESDLAQLQKAASKAPVTPTVSATVTQPATAPIAATENDSTIAAIQAKYGIKPNQTAPTNVAALKR